MTGIMSEQVDVRALLDALAGTERAIAAIDRQQARDYAPYANLLDLLAPSERQLSELFAWLLDPEGTHGQGDVFLRAFLTRFLPDLADAVAGRTPTIWTEAPTRDGRGFMDILIEWPGSAAVAIENKPWAAFQPDQVGRYVREVVGRAPVAYVLVFFGWRGDADAHLDRHLAQNGAAELRGHVLSRHYHEVADWIAEARALARPARVTDILAQCEEYLNGFKEGEREMSAKDLVVAEAVSSPDRLRAAGAIMASHFLIKQRVAGDALKRLSEALAEHDPQDGDFASGKSHSWLSFDVGAGPARLYLWFDAGDFRRLGYGLCDRRSDERDVRPTALSQALEEEYGPTQYAKNGWHYWRSSNDGRSPFSCKDVDDEREFLPWLASGVMVAEVGRLIEQVAAMARVAASEARA